MNIRDVLLTIFALAWLFVVIVTALRTGAVPAELWAVLGAGLGGILAVFRADARFSDHTDRPDRSGKGE